VSAVAPMALPRPAGLVRRALAGVLDALVVALALLALSMVVRWGFHEWLSRQVLDPEGVSYARWSRVLRAVNLGLLAFVPFAYFALLEALPAQATFGKLLLGCRVKRPDGRRAGLLRVAWRTLVKPLSVVPCGLGLLIAGVGRKRALHDRLSGCAVLRRG
jgi:uncharacterized RDD family membrane protein YckC